MSEGFFWQDAESQLHTHQYELIAVQLSGPEGFGSVTVHQSLITLDLVFWLPGGEALQGEEEEDGKINMMVKPIYKVYH